MKLIRNIFFATLLGVTLMGAGCNPTTSTTGTTSTTPAAVPRTFAQGLIYGYETNATVRNAAAAALTAKMINKVTAQQVLTTTNTVRAALDEARVAGCPAMTAVPTAATKDLPACLEGLPPTVTGKLDLAIGLADSSLGFLKTVGAIK
jgi:hypothetical protein